MSSMVSRRPPPSGSTSQSNDRRWMSIRLGTSRDLFRRAKERRSREAATLGKTATPQGVERTGQQGGGALRGKARPSKIARSKAAPAGGIRLSRTPLAAAAYVARRRCLSGFDYRPTAEG